ncbi:MAG TPA: aminotransferase class V-fold PLP-dependent enzyme [Candidatus Binatia bacterium]|nr:aminotransferase class V-fold PLP-dependent enzyme [Candidatus Binatia bacterium]
MDDSRGRAQALDAADPLAGYRARFVIDDPDLVYLDGNSLGRLPRWTAARLAALVRDGWGGGLIRGWDDWLYLPERVGDLVGTGLLGARPGETIVADSTTTNLYRLALAALVARPGRRAIVLDRDEFPTDRYVLEGLAPARGLELRWIDRDPAAGPSAADVSALLDDQVALVVLSHVDYRSAAIADMATIMATTHGAGALALWDLCHSVGAIPVDLTGSGADLAVGCTYKYLNGGPGSPAFLYVRSELQGSVRNPVQGWFGRRDQFAMGPGYQPTPGIRGWLTGTPPVGGLVAVEEGARLVVEAGIDAVGAKGVALTEYAIELHDAWLAPLGCTLGSPRDPALRGAHVSIRHPDAGDLTRRLIETGVVPDFRAPDSIRLGLAPLYTRFGDVWTGLDRLRRLLR